MSCRTRLTMRAFIQRNTVTPDDGYGQPSPASWTALSTTACYAWVTTGDAKHNAEVSLDASRYRAILPAGTDVTSDDRLEKVEDRIGTEKFGVLYIDAILQRRDHLELRMRDHE